MKNIFYILLFSVISFTNAQFFSANHFVLNEGTESDYLKLEQIWKEFHQESVDNGNKLVVRRAPKLIVLLTVFNGINHHSLLAPSSQGDGSALHLGRALPARF